MYNSNKKEQYEVFFSQGVVPLESEINNNKKFCFYRLKETGQIICEFVMNIGLNGKKIEICHITDVHLNYCCEDEDEEVNYTKKYRTWLAGGESVTSLVKAMEVGLYFDQTVITGDILDYLSNGAKRLAQKHIFSFDKGVICTVGSHDATKQMQTGLENNLSLNERFSILQEFWPHDIYYISKVIKESVILVGLNTAYTQYYPQQVDRLKKDVEKARKENKYILIFQHDPISTGNPSDTKVEPILSVSQSHSKVRNFYSERIGNTESINAITKEVYEIITHNADVIKGLFCGHFHDSFYTEIKAFDIYGNETVIPQITTAGNPFFDRVGVLTRIIIE